MEDALNRRKPRWAGWILVGTLLLAAAGCRELPRDEYARLRQVRSELLDVQADIHLPDKFRSFDVEFSNARLVWARAESSFFPETEELARELRQLSATGEALRAESLQVRQRVQAEQQRQLEALSEGVRSWLGQTLDPSLRRAIGKLELAVEQARREWEQGRYERVTQLLEDVHVETDRVKSHFLGLQQRYRDPGQLRIWTRWIQATVGESKRSGGPALVVDKLRGRATLVQGGRKVADFGVDLGWNWFFDKLHQGDGATPEGQYRVVRKKGAGQTQYTLALLLDYPNQDDLRRFRTAKRSGRIGRKAGIGGLIEIHGEGGRGSNWTQGCVALDNEDMRKLFDLAPVGMAVTIVGTAPEGSLG